MYKEEQILIHQKLNQLISNGHLSSQTIIYIFGVNDYTREIIRYLKKRNLSVKYIIDNDKRKQGLYYEGVQAVPISLNNNNEINRYILCSPFGREMSAQLLTEGVLDHQIVNMRLQYQYYCDSLWEDIKYTFRGKRIYQKLCRKYPDHKIFLCPYTGTGDVYLIGTFLKSYLEKENISKYVMVVVTNACKKVLEMFSIENIVCLSSLKANHSLTKYYHVCQQECEITILNDSWPTIYTNNVQWVRGLHGMNFAEMFKTFVFHLEKECKPIHPILPYVDNEIKTLFNKNNLIEGKTVILSPYSNTLTDLNKEFWENVADKLIKKGYTVCTNANGKDETAIKGTAAFFFPLNIAPQVISKAGGFIGIRSGLCDVISAAKATKVILYDAANFFFNSSAFEYFNLRDMGLSEDAIEIEYDNKYIQQLETQVLNYF